MLSFARPAPAPFQLSNSVLPLLRDPAVRDLAWVIASPGLLDANHAEYARQVVDDAWCEAQLRACLAWLLKLDTAPHALHRHIATHASRRLGLYFETLIAFWLTHAPHIQLISRNLQVRDGNRTMGEYDLLWRDETGHVRHWEAAVKFYLQAEAIPATRAFVGPGARDRLDLKLDRVFQHQLVLGRTPAGLASLPDGIKLGGAQAFIKGYLFYPAGATEAQATPGVSPSHLRGWWQHHSSMELPQSQADTRWVVVPRLRWLAPLRMTAGAEMVTQDEMCAALERHFALSHRALLLAEMMRVEDSSWQECARGFVVHADWPHLQDKDQ